MKNENKERAEKQIERLLREAGCTKNQICIFAEANEVSHYDIWIGTDSSHSFGSLLIEEHATSIGLHAEREADELAAALGVLSERQFDAQYSQD